MTRYYMTDGQADLDVLVADDTDLDGEFEAHCLDTGDTLIVRGWMMTDVAELPL